MGTQIINAPESRAEVVHATLDVAGAAVTTLDDAAGRLGMAFRGVDVSAANQELADFAGSLASLVEATTMVAGVLAVDLNAVGDGSTSANVLLAELSTCTDDLISAHQAGDWMTLADLIEYDIRSSLQRWPAVIDALRHQAPDLSGGPA